MSGIPTGHIGNIASKVVDAATKTVASKTTEKLYEGFIEGAMEVGVRDGLPALVKYIRGNKALNPGDEEKLLEAFNLYKEGKKNEAFTHVRTNLGHWFAGVTLDDEFMQREDGFRAVRQGLITNAERIAILKVLKKLPHKIRKNLRDIHTRQADDDIRASNFAAMKGLKKKDLVMEAQGLGLTEPHPLDSAGKAAKKENARLDTEFEDQKKEFAEPLTKGVWKRFFGR